jgi:hypothetical protein
MKIAKINALLVINALNSLPNSRSLLGEVVLAEREGCRKYVEFSRFYQLVNYYITEVLAFPRSLAVFQRGIFSWNTNGWLGQFPTPQLAMRKIADHCNNETLHESQICEFKGSPVSNEQFSHAPDIRLRVVFPYMTKSFESKEMQRSWTNDIVIPLISHHVDSDVRRYIPTSYELLRLNSEGNKESIKPVIRSSAGDIVATD